MAQDQDADVRDLFGSDDEDVPRPPAPASSAGSARSARSSARSIGGFSSRAGRPLQLRTTASAPTTPTERPPPKRKEGQSGSSAAAGTPTLGSAPVTPKPTSAASAGTPHGAARTPIVAAGTPASAAGTPKPTSAAATPTFAPGTRTPTAKPPPGDDDDDDRGLFGSDEEEADDKELFGSDDDKSSKPGSSKHESGQSKSGAGVSSVITAEEEALFGDVELREMDEKDIFGELSDDETHAPAEEVTLRRRALPCKGREFTRLKLPNILSVEKVPFDKETFDPETTAASIENEHFVKGTRDSVKLTHPENTIRWRFKRDKDGNTMKDTHGRPQYESNARFVEWEDGSWHFMIGNEAFSVLQRGESNQLLFNENRPEVMVNHGELRKSLLLTPVGITSKTHETLKQGQFNKILPDRKSLLVTIEHSNAQKEVADIAIQDEERRAKRARKERDAEGITAGFLEGADYDGPSVADIKKQYRSSDANRRNKEIEDITSRHVK